MYKNKKWLVFFGLFFIFSFAFLIPETSAQTQYQLLEKIPGATGNNLGQYLGSLYTVALAIIVLSSVFMLSIGGFMYLTSAGNTAAMGTAKTIIVDSIIGLILALVAYLILFVINPDLVRGNVPGLAPGSALPAPTTGTPPAQGPGGTQTPPTGDDVSLATQILAMGVLASSGDCSSPSGIVSPQSNMTSVKNGKLMAACYACGKSGYEGTKACADDAVRPNTKMLQAIVAVRNSGLSFTITSISGGNHSDSSAHYNGKGIDVAPATQALLNAFIANGASPTSFCENKSGGRVNGCGGGADHIHIVFP